MNDMEHNLGLIAGHAYAIDDFEGSISLLHIFLTLIRVEHENQVPQYDTDRQTSKSAWRRRMGRCL